jgi:hypothetical protein
MTPNKLAHLFVATLLAASYVAASGLTISGIYYDPIQAENGGEAIQLENSGTQPVDLSSVLLATKQSNYPFPAITLLPGEGYLVADTNWSAARDNLSWPGADLELPLSLANTDGFVSLIENGSVLDTLAWNTSFKAKEGKMITPAGEQIPFFRNSSSTTTTLNATIIVLDMPPSITNVTVTDDTPTLGIQLLSYSRILRVAAQITESNNQSVQATVTFRGQTYPLSFDGTLYSAAIPFSQVTPEEYLLQITASDGSTQSVAEVPVTVLASSSTTISGEMVLRGAPGTVANGSFSITNDGNVAKRITIQHTIPNATCSTSVFTLQPEEAQEVVCSASIPLLTPATYQYVVRVTAT